MSILGLNGREGQRQPTAEEIAEYQRQQKIVLEAPYFVCENEECGGKNFMHIFRFKKVSGLLDGSGQDKLIQVPGVVCADCGTVPKQFLRNMEILEDEKPPKPKENKSEDNVIKGNFE